MFDALKTLTGDMGDGNSLGNDKNASSTSLSQQFGGMGSVNINKPNTALTVAVVFIVALTIAGVIILKGKK